MIKSVRREPQKFIPSYNGNRDDEDPLWVKIMPLNRDQADRYANLTNFKQKKGSKGEWKSNAIAVQKKQFTENVTEVYGFNDAENDSPITDINRFYNEAHNELIEEILTVLLDSSQLEDQERKN